MEFTHEHSSILNNQHDKTTLVQYVYTDRTLLGQAIFCISNWQGLTRTSQIYIPDYCRRLGSRQQLNLGLRPKEKTLSFSPNGTVFIPVNRLVNAPLLQVF